MCGGGAGDQGGSGASGGSVLQQAALGGEGRRIAAALPHLIEGSHLAIVDECPPPSAASQLHSFLCLAVFLGDPDTT